MDGPTENIEIRTFATLSEIWDVPGFKHDNPITKDNYNRLRGDYWFPDEVNCCFQKENGNLCNEEHKWGFVAELKDGTLTIVGNNCAISKFDANSRFKVDRAKYLNEKNRRERLATLSNLLAEKEERMAGVYKAREQLNSLHGRIQRFKSNLGYQTQRRLEDMARTGGADVTIIGVNYRNYLDEDGVPRRERSAAPSRLGSILGIGCLTESNYKGITSDIFEVEQAYKIAAQITKDIKLSALESLTSSISNTNRIINIVADLIEQEKAFQKNDFSLLCFLTSDKVERYKTARIVLEWQGLEAGKDKAKDWLAKKDREIRESLGIEKIEIP